AHEKLSTLSYKNNMAGTSTIPPPRPTRLPTTAAKKPIINPKTITTYITYLFNFNDFYIILPFKFNDFYFIYLFKLVLSYLRCVIPLGIFLVDVVFIEPVQHPTVLCLSVPPFTELVDLSSGSLFDGSTIYRSGRALQQVFI